MLDTIGIPFTPSPLLVDGDVPRVAGTVPIVGTTAALTPQMQVEPDQDDGTPSRVYFVPTDGNSFGIQVVTAVPATIYGWKMKDATLGLMATGTINPPQILAPNGGFLPMDRQVFFMGTSGIFL